MRIPPITAITRTKQIILLIRKDRLCDVQILNIIYLIPLFSFQRQRTECRIIQHRNHTQHLLIVLVIAQSGTIRLQKRHIHMLRKILRELIDIHRLVIIRYFFIAKLAIRDKTLNTVLFIYRHNSPIHPTLIFINQSQIRIWMFNQLPQYRIFQDDIRL